MYMKTAALNNDAKKTLIVIDKTRARGGSKCHVRRCYSRNCHTTAFDHRSG